MPLPTELELIAGAKELFDWFGYWPDFHDAEVLKFHLDPATSSSLVVHTWEMTNRVNAEGYYDLTKHVVVEFVLEEMSKVDLADLWGTQYPPRLGRGQKRGRVSTEFLRGLWPLRSY